MYWEFYYFAVALCIAILWRPSEDATHYALLGGGEDDVNGGDGKSSSTPGMISERERRWRKRRSRKVGSILMMT